MKAIQDKPHMTRIADIKIGQRHRRDLGDLRQLAASISEVGLLHPVVVNADGTLVAGERRLEACKSLGWQEVPVTAVNLGEIVRGEFAENAYRKDFLPSEIDAIRRAMEPIEKAAAKERMSAGGKGAKVSQPSRATDKIGAFAGISGRTVEKIAAVVTAAEADPKYLPLVERMDSTGRVHGVFRHLKIAQQAAVIRQEAPPLPGRGPYRVLVVDPPWDSVRADDPSQRGTPPYPVLGLSQICAVPVATIAHTDAVLWLWTTNFHLVTGEALAVIRAWGFEPKTMITWAKDKMGTGDWLRGQTEQCIMAVRGKPTVQLSNQTTLLRAPVRAHSQKPVEFYDLVESLCPAPRYATLFHRGATRDRWDGHGDELGSGIAAS